MKNRRRLIIVILTVAILVSISVPVLAAPYVLVPENTITRGYFRYYGSFRQEQFTAKATVIGGINSVAGAWRKPNGTLTSVGSYVLIGSGETRTISSGWADHPTSYTPGACKVR